MKECKNTSTHNIPKHQHIHKPTHYKTHRHTHHVFQNKLKQPQYKIHAKSNSHNTVKSSTLNIRSP